MNYSFFYHSGFLAFCLHLYHYIHNISADMSSGEHIGQNVVNITIKMKTRPKTLNDKNHQSLSQKFRQLSYTCTPNVANLINNSDAKKLRNKQCSEPPKCNCIDNTIHPLKEKCQYECTV